MPSTTTSWDLWRFPTAPGSAPDVFLQTPFSERQPRISPDGAWVSFTSNESSTNEIYVTTFPTAGRRHRISTNTGSEARWSADGRTLYFRSRNRLMAASFAVAPARQPEIGAPRELFVLPENTGHWLVADNGRRFLVNVEVTPSRAAPMTVMLNWPRLVPR